MNSVRSVRSAHQRIHRIWFTEWYGIFISTTWRESHWTCMGNAREAFKFVSWHFSEATFWDKNVSFLWEWCIVFNMHQHKLLCFCQAVGFPLSSDMKYHRVTLIHYFINSTASNSVCNCNLTYLCTSWRVCKNYTSSNQQMGILWDILIGIENSNCVFIEEDLPENALLHLFFL